MIVYEGSSPLTLQSKRLAAMPTFLDRETHLSQVCICPLLMSQHLCNSLVADIVLNGVDACIKADSIVLHNDFLLDKSVHLLLQEVALINIIGLQLLVVFLQV